MAITESLVRIVAPFDCLFCGYEGKLACPACAVKLASMIPERCYRCHKATDKHATCQPCRRVTPLVHVWVVTELHIPAKRLLYAFKFERARAGAAILAELMAGTVPKLSPGTIIVPVPTATKRVRMRGYDHAELLAKELSKLTGLEYDRQLVRLNQTRQVGAKREDRLKQLKGAYRIRRPSALSGRNILLVDDVITTGATLEEAARLLKKHGAGQIGAVVFAQKQ